MNINIERIGDKYKAKLIDFDIEVESDTFLGALVSLTGEMAFSSYENTIATVCTWEFE